MTATQDLYSLSFTTKPDAGEGKGLDFLRPDRYTAAQLLAEVADLAQHPDNAHVESVEICRIGKTVDGAAELTPVAINGNATCGFSFEHWTVGYDTATCTIIDDHRVAARKLVELLSCQDVERIKMFW